MNAYNHIPCYKDVYDKDGNFIGTSTAFKARCTAKTNGSVEIKKPNGEKFWYSGTVTPYLNFWKLIDYN
tara:strand:+ start:950 stop:1156 length:207 start_codon:yes stop_codon:yes gene_type:complete